MKQWVAELPLPYVGGGWGEGVNAYLLKSVKRIDSTGKTHGVNRSVGIASMVLNDLQNSCVAKTCKGFGVLVLLALLGNIERMTHHILYLIRKCFEVTSG